MATVVREAAQARQQPSPASPEPPPSWLTEALTRWQAGPPDAGVPELAAAAGRSREHLARTVRRHFATSPSHLLNQTRCDRAAALLRDGSQPILDLALASGFANLGQFYRCFQTRFGTSPRRYREGFRGVI
jgi:AraC family cel operon transcriptional repressor